ncbi:MAG: ABC transporter ATP-binding protein [Oscillospiraceae bacterium]|nr:ABC transporter ATP-binding protein [Oscillospiraceae bacterium]
MSEMVAIKGLNQKYDKRPVLSDVNISVMPGSITGLLGPNGCGKTTLIKIIAGLIKDYTGDVKIMGLNPGVETKAVISYLPEKTYLKDWHRAKDAFDMFSDFYKDFDKAKAKELISRLQIEPNARIVSMSKGMQEKLQLALIMSRSAKLYLLDEPLGGIDPATRTMILDMILQNYTEDASLLISTHLIHDVERIFDHVVMMGFGQIIINEPLDAIRVKYGKSLEDIFREVFKC